MSDRMPRWVVPGLMIFSALALIPFALAAKSRASKSPVPATEKPSWSCATGIAHVMRAGIIERGGTLEALFSSTLLNPTALFGLHGLLLLDDGVVHGQELGTVREGGLDPHLVHHRSSLGQRVAPLITHATCQGPFPIRIIWLIVLCPSARDLQWCSAPTKGERGAPPRCAKQRG